MRSPTASLTLGPKPLTFDRAVAASLAPHPPHERIDVNVPEYLDEVAPIIVLRPLAIAARCANPAPRLVQGRQAEDWGGDWSRHPNELGTNARAVKEVMSVRFGTIPAKPD
jgi:hypothetical protein